MRAVPTADGLLTGFFTGRVAAASASERSVVLRLDADLRLAVELEGERLLDDDEQVLLAAERQFDRLGAVARVAGPVALVRVLERYVGDPVYRPHDRVDARTRVDACAALLRAIAVQPTLHGRARLLRRADEAIRVEAGLTAVRRLSVRRVRR
ncbi:hypothetical protein [Amnibacterium endophyticum]|uniref:Uncharacterized protein n=1 Tax=Amnibacterium endophyticum TaxID=2109337 RepID=A0ABW4LIJ7_9MICO